MEQHDRLSELRRRVQADPASVAFAELAEACRRDGANDEAVALCRTGLQHHPGYLSARITLALALLELSRLDDAETELRIALETAPAHLAANRALAEVYQRRGQRPEAGALYRKALELAGHHQDNTQPDGGEGTVATPDRKPAASVVKDLFDFDTLLEQLGGRTQSAQMPAKPVMPVMPVTPITLPEPPADEGDPFSVLERQLRIVEDRPVQAPPSDEELRELRILDELEDWLSAIVTDRDNHPAA